MKFVYFSSNFISVDRQLHIFKLVICSGSVSFQDEEPDVVTRDDIFKVCEVICWYESGKARVRQRFSRTGPQWQVRVRRGQLFLKQYQLTLHSVHLILEFTLNLTLGFRLNTFTNRVELFDQKFSLGFF